MVLEAGEAVHDDRQVYVTDVDDLWDAVHQHRAHPAVVPPGPGELRPGGHYELERNASGTITECDPPAWVRGHVGVRRRRELDRGAADTVDGDRTRFELTHLAHHDERWEPVRSGAGGVGWDLALLGLSLHLAGHADRPAEADTWPGTPEGVAFMTASGRAWGQAHVAAGQDEATAGAAVERTVAAYTQPQ